MKRCAYMQIGKIEIDAELFACIVEIASDIGYMLDAGIDREVLDGLAELHNRLEQLIKTANESLATA